MKDDIYMAGASITELEEKYVIDALRNGWYKDKYYYCEQLEKEFAEYHNRKYALMTPNCTSALQLILASLGVGPGDEVIVPECTWIASSVGIVHLGAKPIFCDIEETSWCLSPQSLLENITEKTKAVICVDIFGNMANWDEITKICDDKGIHLIEDAAEALGSTYNNKKAGEFGIASAFSFHNTKTMTTGEGGMLLLNDDELFNKCVKLRDLGRGPETKAYYNEIIGYKFMPFNLQAALGLAQFHRLDELISMKRHHLNFYRENLSDLNVEFNYEPDNVVNGAWITSMVISKDYNIDKETFIKKLDELNTPIRPFFYPLSSIPAYNESFIYKSKNPVSYDISNRGVNLPGAYNLTDDQLLFICENIKKVLS